jgi:type I restriction enzyme M protein
MIGRRGGEYLTPGSVRKLLIALAEPAGVLYNPASGVGQLIVDAATHHSSAVTNIFGQEINHRGWAMAQLNLAIHAVQADIAIGDVFAEDRFPDLHADCVVAVPPWAQKLTVADRLVDDPRWVYGEPGPNDGNVAWIQHCLHHLADHGRAILVLPNRVLFEGGRAGRIRQRLVKAGLLDAVFALPSGLFPSTSLACSVLIFAKNRSNADVNRATLMVTIGDPAERRTSRSSDLSDAVISEAALLYREWTAGREPIPPNSAIARFDDIVLNDFVIDPGRYLSVARTTQDIGDIVKRRSTLQARLQQLTQESRDADNQLRAILQESPR